MFLLQAQINAIIGTATVQAQTAQVLTACDKLCASCAKNQMVCSAVSRDLVYQTWKAAPDPTRVALSQITDATLALAVTTPIPDLARVGTTIGKTQA